MEQVIVMSPVVLLNKEIAFPALKVASGIVIEPLEPTSINEPKSLVVSVYELVLALPD
jgi:hypothetical protein